MSPSEYISIAAIIAALMVSAIGGFWAWSHYMQRAGSWRAKIVARLDSGEQAHGRITTAVEGLAKSLDDFVKESRQSREGMRDSFSAIQTKVGETNVKVTNLEKNVDLLNRKVFNGKGKKQ